MTTGLLRVVLTFALIVVCGAIVMFLPGRLSGWLDEFPQIVTVATVIAFLSIAARIESRLRS